MRFLILAVLVQLTGAAPFAAEGVILLHGLCRTDRSMTKMASALEKEGYVVLNIDYPSRTATIEELAEKVIGGAVRSPKLAEVVTVHFVAHSLGGILVRQYVERTPIDRLGRVVMLGPPNQGSEVVDRLGNLGLFEHINGPAGKQLGTAPNSVPNRLKAARFDVGVIAGDRSVNWINSAMIPGADDGKVSVERTRLAGMKDHIVVHATHPLIMRNDTAIRQTLQFLRSGKFLRVDGSR